MGFLIPKTRISTSNGQTSEFGITSSEFGRAIPELFGQDRLGGNVIWTDGLRQERVTDVQNQGGKGAPKVETTTNTFEYFVDLAVLLCEGPVQGFRRIWGDGKLIYDGAGLEEVTMDGLNIRFYSGDEEQLPDPLIEQSVGVGLTPAYRGRCYMVFETLPLANFGNRIPSLTIELGTEDASFTVTVEAEFFTNVLLDSFERISADTTGIYKVSPVTPGRVWSQTFASANGGPTVNTFYEFNPGSSEIPNQITIDDGNLGAGSTLLGISRNGDLLVAPVTTDLADQLSIYSMGGVRTANVEIGRQTTSAIGLTLGFDHIMYRSNRASFSEIGYGVVDIAASPTDDGSGIFPDGGSAVQTFLQALDPDNESCVEPVQGVNNDGWGLFCRSDIFRLVRSTVSGSSIVQNITPDDIVPDAVSFTNLNRAFNGNEQNLRFQRDSATGYFIFSVHIDSVPYVFAWTLLDGLIWATPVPFTQDVRRGGSGYVDGVVMHTENGSGGHRFLALNTTDGSIRPGLSGDVQTEVPNASATFNGSFFEPVSGTVTIPNDVNFNNDFGWHTTRIVGLSEIRDGFLAEGELNPRAAITRVCDLAGLPAVDIDVSQVPETVPGLGSLLVNDRQTAGEALGPLLTMLRIDVFESNFLLCFKPRGASQTNVIIDVEDMVPNGETEGETFARNTIDKRELPTRFEVGYRDRNNAYQAGSQNDRRANETQFSRQSEGYEYSGAADANLGKQSAQIELYTRWVERDRFRLRLPPSRIGIDAADVVTIRLRNGVLVRGRVDRSDIGSDFNNDIDIIAETTDLYTAVVVGDSGEALQTTIPFTGDSDLFLLDMPLLRDIDSLGQEQSGFYWAASGPPVWNGAVLFREDGPSSIRNLGRTVVPATHGVLLETLPAADTVTRFSSQSTTLGINLGVDNIVSVTEADIFAGNNAVAILGANGIEIIQFQTSELVSDSRANISRILRGRRGTEHLAVAHPTGTPWVLLRPADLVISSNPAAPAGSPVTYRGNTIGQLYEAANPISFTQNCNDLRPYSPVNISGELQMSGDLQVSGIRRTRIGGELTDLMDVPLSETISEFELDILDGGTVVRTLTSTTPDFTYVAADITTDFGSVPTTIDVVMYQLSGAVGRGFPGAATLET